MRLKNKVLDVRSQIQTLSAERVGILAQPSSRAAIQARLIATVSTWVDQNVAKQAADLQRLAVGQSAEVLTVSAQVMTPQGPLSVKLYLGPLMVCLLGSDAVKAAVLSGLDTVPEGLDAVAQKARLAAIAADLHELQTREESLIRDAELVNEVIPRRIDADPAYVLALDP